MQRRFYALIIFLYLPNAQYPHLFSIGGEDLEEVNPYLVIVHIELQNIA